MFPIELDHKVQLQRLTFLKSVLLSHHYILMELKLCIIEGKEMQIVVNMAKG